MTKRQTQLFALFLLIGAPLVLSALNGYFLPPIEDIAPLPAQQSASQADMQPAQDPAAVLPPAHPTPPPNHAVQSGPQPGGNYTPVAALDPQGTTIAGTDPIPVLSTAGSDVSSADQGGGQQHVPSTNEPHATHNAQ